MLIVPGINNSGPEHWQSRWESDRPESVRLDVADWDYPVLEDWLEGLEEAIARCQAAPVVVAHSLGCILTARWAERADANEKIRGAFLVAPPDPQGALFPVEASTFRIVPRGPLDTPCVVVASTDDPYCEIDEARRFANVLGAGFVSVGAFGHINSESGLGAWSQGRDLLECFAAGLGVRV